MTTIVTRAGKGSPLTHTEVDTNFTNLNTNKLETAAIPLGTLAAPSISFVGDANTGIYSPGAYTLAFVTAGSNRVHITSAGLVGIGISAPQGRLHVIGDSATAGVGNINISNAAYPTSGWAFRIPDSGSGIDLSLDGAIAGTFRSVMYFARSSGNVGIGSNASNANGGILQLSSGITFPATAVAATDANTLDDYEEGTWTPGQGTGVTVVGAFSSIGNYTKIGRTVIYAGYIVGATSIAFNPAGGNLVNGGLPFSVFAGLGCGIAAASPTTSIIAYGSGTGLEGSASIGAVGVIYFSGSYLV